MRATNLKKLSRTSFLILAMLYMAHTLWADVDIFATYMGDGVVVISFDARSEPNLVRAFALDIRLANDANIVDVSLLNADYIIFPGSIQIDAEGNITDYGSPVAPYSDLPGGTLPGLDSNGVTIELASLYAPVGPGSPNAPDPCGPLVTLTVDKNTCLTITANIARAGSSGVVMESPDEAVTVNLPPVLCPIGPKIDCMKETCPEYSDWVAWHCRGDYDGCRFGPFWVQVLDLEYLKAAFNKLDNQLPPAGICCDFDHKKIGPFRVNVLDLDIFKQYFNKIESQVPCCDDDEDCDLTDGDTCYNFWATPTCL
jgi:hypothetical protein